MTLAFALQAESLEPSTHANCRDSLSQSSRTARSGKIQGTPTRAGVQYGRKYRAEIYQFLNLLKNDNTFNWEGTREIAHRYEEFIKTFTPFTFAFLNGVAQGSKVDRLDLVTLLAHEEIVHHPHCTGISAKDPHTQKTVLGQTWDWAPRYAPFGSVVEYDIKGGQKVLSYHFPGLWSAMGINKAGLSLVWTGVGYYPNVKPMMGVPTYAIISELLQKKSVDEAVEFLERIPNAGSFAFLIADDHETAAIEAAPNKVVVDRESNTHLRANHYDMPELKDYTHQKLELDHESIRRRAVLERRTREAARSGSLDIDAIHNILGKSTKISEYGEENATIALIALDPAKRELHFTVGGFPFQEPQIFRFTDSSE